MTYQGIRAINKVDGSNVLDNLNVITNELSKGQKWGLRFYSRDIGNEGDYSNNNGLLRTNGIQYGLDLSEVISHRNPQLVMLRMEVCHPSAINMFLNVYPAMNSTEPNRFYVMSQAANAYNSSQVILPIDSTKSIAYRASNTTFTLAQINILGWWGY
jgi:hypothetical protein